MSGFTTLNIEGMTCMSCVTKVDSALRDVDGVMAVHVDLEGNKAVVSGGDEMDLVQAVENAGFRAKL